MLAKRSTKSGKMILLGLAVVGCNALLGNESADVAAGGNAGSDLGGGTLGTGGTAGSAAGSSGQGGAGGGEMEDAASIDATSGADGDAGRETSSSIDASSTDAQGADVRRDAAPSDARADAAPDVPRCIGIDGCATGYNCDDGTCVPATVSCAAQKSARPTSPDGVYWINPTGTPMRAYCDMQIPSELCTEIEGEHHGRTREGSSLVYAMRSILLAGEGKCNIWAVRGSLDGYPLHAIELVGGQKLGACQALGFVRDVMLGACAFGDGVGYSSCGFAGSPLYQWGNHCSGCVVGDGVYATYVKQGPVHSSSVLSSFDGSMQSQCAVR